MPEHIWSVLCYKGCLDQYTNQVSLLDAIEAITLRPLEAIPSGDNVSLPVQLHLVTLWARADFSRPETGYSRLLLRPPHGPEIVANETVVDLTTAARTRSFLRFESIPFRGFGVYRFIVQHRNDPGEDWAQATSIPLELRLESSATQPASQLGARKEPRVGKKK